MPQHGFTHESTINESKEWYTPLYLFSALGCDFDLDPCSPGKEIVPWIPVKKTISLPADGLAVPWAKGDFVFMNPPYGEDTPRWMKKLAEHGNGIALVFNRSETEWFQSYATKADAILFVAGRVNFIPSWLAARYWSGECMTSDGRLKWPKTMPIVDGEQKKKSGSGTGNILVGYGERAYEVLLEADGLGTVFIPQEHSTNWPCSESSLSETIRQEEGSGV